MLVGKILERSNKFLLCCTHAIQITRLCRTDLQADVIVWDFESLHQLCKLTLHRVKVQSLAFSPSDKYLVTLGGGDDGR